MKGFLALVLLAPLGFGQSQSFDSYTYTAPPGYTLRAHQNAQEWSKIDQKRRFYCQIGLYRAQNSLGSPAQDMDNEWQAVVVKQFKVNGSPASKELPLPNAPSSMVRGAETIDGNGNKAISSLFVVRSGSRYVGVLFNAPNAEAFQACQEDITQVVASLRLPDAGPAPAAAPAVSAAPPARISGSLPGSWERVIMTQPAMRYNPISKQMEYNPVAALNQFKQTHTFRFGANGQYEYDLIADDYNRSQRSRVLERGIYTIGGGAIQFVPKSYQDGKGPKGQDPPLTNKAVPAPHSRRFSIGDHPQYKDSVGLQLQTADGGWETFRPAK